jgi:membrane associated rhomboid family serine protease
MTTRQMASVFVDKKERQSMSQTLIVLGVLIIVLAAAIHWVISGITLFPHAALIIGAIGAVVAVVGIVMMMRPRAAK